MSKRKSTILIIDDEEDFCLFIKRNLELTDNYKIIVATAGKKGIWLARLAKPDLILLDIMMAGIGGLEVLERLKGDEEKCNIPIVVVSARGDNATKEQAMSLHCDDYIVKPVKVEILISKIEDILSKSQK